MSEADDILVRAADPHISQAELFQIASQYPRAYPLIAANPKAYPDLVEWLRNNGDEFTRAVIHQRDKGLLGAQAYNAAVKVIDDERHRANKTQDAELADQHESATSHAHDEAEKDEATGEALPEGSVAEKDSAPASTASDEPAEDAADAVDTPEWESRPTALMPAISPQSPEDSTTAVHRQSVIPSTLTARYRAPQDESEEGIDTTQNTAYPSTIPAYPDHEAAPDPYLVTEPQIGTEDKEDKAASAENHESERSGGMSRGVKIALVILGILLLIAIIVVALVAYSYTHDGQKQVREEETISSSVSAPRTPSSAPSSSESTDTETPIALPAPEGAQDVTSFITPSSNIYCLLEGDSAQCTILAHNGNECSGGPLTLTITKEGTTQKCGGAPGGDGPSLGYGQAAAHGDIACTSEQNGVTCWDQRTRHGLHLQRDSWDTNDR